MMSAFCLLAEWARDRATGATGWVALGVSFVAGAILTGVVPAKPDNRPLLVIIYVLATPPLLFFYVFWFSAVVFHDAL